MSAPGKMVAFEREEGTVHGACLQTEIGSTCRERGSPSFSRSIFDFHGAADKHHGRGENTQGQPISGATLSISTVTDFDGNVYHEVKIGTQVWMMENLQVTKYNDGTAIEKDTSAVTWASATTPKYCFYENTTDQALIGKYGALYNGHVVSPANTRTIAPAGWHVPSDAEWNILQDYLIDNGYNWDGEAAGNKIAKSLAATTDCTSSTDAGTSGYNLSTNNQSGFSALPGRFRAGGSGSFSGMTRQGNWWSDTEQNATRTWSRSLFYSSDTLARTHDPMQNGNLVRLLKD